MSPSVIEQRGMVGRLELTADTAVVTLVGEVDLAVAGQAESLLDQAIGAERPRTVVEMEGVTHLDSTAMRVLLDAHRDAVARGRALVVRNLRGHARTMTRLAGLHLTLVLEDAPGLVQTEAPPPDPRRNTSFPEKRGPMAAG